MAADTEALAHIAVLVSGHGRGSNMQAIIDGCATGEIPGRVCVVIGTRADAPALERARAAGVETAVVSPRKYQDDMEGYGQTLMRILRRHTVEIICLAGYMRILPPEVVTAFPQRILNIHPALLPLFGGKGMYGEHVHRAVIESGMKVSGCTVHLVDENYDEGPIVLQTAVPVLDEDTPETLAARVLPEEHRLYGQAVRLVAENRLRVVGRRVIMRP